MPLPAPWNTLEESISREQDYAAGAERLAGFFKATEERIRPDALFKILLDAKPTLKWMERFAFCLLNTGVSDRQTGLRALEGRRLLRLARKITVGAPLLETEVQIAEQLRTWLETGTLDLPDFVRRGREVFERMLQGEKLEEAEIRAVTFLIRSEGQALRERVNWLSENADPYNMKTMARILPRLRVYDEGLHEALRLADKIEAGETVGETRLSLETHFKEAGLNKWVQHLSASAYLRPWVVAVEMQREKKVPTLDLIALATLSRYVFEARNEKPDPLVWIGYALRSWQGGGFSLEAGETASVLRPALTGMGLKVVGSRVEGDFHKRTYVDLIGKDLLTRPYAHMVDEGALDMKTLLAQNMGRDSVLEALLNNPKVYQSPGMVEFVANMTRSVPVLSKIAKSRFLHSGYANRDVPLALLNNPGNVPLSLLRPFIHTRYVPMVDLKHLGRRSAGIRPEVRREVEQYLLEHT